MTSFASLVDPGQRLWLIFLLSLWAALLLGGFLFGASAKEDGRRMPRWTRLASSAVLVTAGWSWVLATRASPAAPYAWLIALGMTLGFAADCFLAGVLLRSGGKIAGILTFGLGHICYITGIFWLGRLLGLTDMAAIFGGLLLWWAIGLAGWYLIVYRNAIKSRIHWLVLAYAMLLATTAGAACGLSLQEPAFWPLLLGAALFLLSDTILGGSWFSDFRLPLIHDIIWLTYGPGQMLIVYSIGIAAAMAGGVR